MQNETSVPRELDKEELFSMDLNDINPPHPTPCAASIAKGQKD